MAATNLYLKMRKIYWTFLKNSFFAVFKWVYPGVFLQIFSNWNQPELEKTSIVQGMVKKCEKSEKNAYVKFLYITLTFSKSFYRFCQKSELCIEKYISF